MTDRSDAPCGPWDVDRSICPSFAEGGDEELITKSIMWATTYLWRRSGRKFGSCPKTVRIMVDGCSCSPCVCGPKAVLNLSSSAPVTAITSITDAASDTFVDEDRYAIIDDRGVGLVDGSCSWTSAYCGELIIAFQIGYTPDEEALVACAALAEERYRVWDDMTCTSPLKNAQLGGYRRGRNGRRDVILCGIPIVDQWLLSLPPGPAGMLDPAEVMAYVEG